MITVTEKPRQTCHPQSGLVNIQGRFPDLRVHAFPGLPNARAHKWLIGSARRQQLRGQFWN